MKRVRDIQWEGDRGEGSVFYFVDAETKAKVSRNLYVSYRVEGKQVVVSAKTEDLGDAKRELKRLTRNRENAKEQLDVLKTPKVENVTVGDLLDANLRRAESKGLLSLREMKYQTEVLRALLGDVRAVDFRPEHVDDYQARRLAGKGSRHGKKVSKTTVRHELEVLSRAFRYAVERRVLRQAPFIERPTEDNVREQEIPLDEFPKILEAMAAQDGQKGQDARDFVEWMLLTAMRPKGVGAFRWEWFDVKTWTLKVPSQKGGQAREFAIEGTLRRVIERRIARRRLDCPFIFHRDGQQLDARRVRRVFYEALEACELPTGRAGFLLYDTKKTAAGVLIDAGLSEREAMHFSGHKTASMFDRYVIKSSERHRANVRQRDQYLAERLGEKQASVGERDANLPKVFDGKARFES